MKDSYPTMFLVPKGEVLRREERKVAVEVAKTTDAVAYLASRGWILIKPEVGNILEKVKALRDAQNMHAKTLNYGYRCLAIRLGKEVDEMLDKLKIE